MFPQKGCHGNLVYFCDLEKHGGAIEGKLPLTQIVFEFEYDFQYITTTGTRAVFRTDRGAPNYCLLSIDLDSPHYTNWTTLIGEHDRNVLEWAACVSKDRLVTCYMVDVKNALKVFDLATGLYQFDFPLDIGSVVGFSGEKKHSELFYKFSSMITPGIIYRVDMSKGDPPKAELFLSTEIKGLDPSQYTVEQVFFPSRDKTMVPMFIASRKDEKRDGSAACLLYGYGGFNISLTPCFSITQLFFVQHFGYLAIPNIRGGGEYGEKWHKGGCLLNKQVNHRKYPRCQEALDVTSEQHFRFKHCRTILNFSPQFCRMDSMTSPRPQSTSWPTTTRARGSWRSRAAPTAAFSSAPASTRGRSSSGRASRLLGELSMSELIKGRGPAKFDPISLHTNPAYIVDIFAGKMICGFW